MKASTIYLDKEALRTNLDFIRRHLKNGVRLSSVVKGNAYGHGIEEMIPLLEKEGLDHFSVFSSAEGKRVFESLSAKKDIAIMGHIDDRDYDWVVQEDIESFVFNFSRLDRLSTLAEKFGKKARVHLEIETGMNRTGFEQKDWQTLIAKVKNDPNLILEGICTHFSGAESIGNYRRIQGQRKQFKKFIKLSEEHGLNPRFRHTSCSAGLISFPSEQWNMVRVGILQYGLWPSKETYISYLTKKNLINDPLKRVISWKSQVMDIKNVKKDQFIGYGISLLSEKNMKIASIPVGYSDGYSRLLSNQGKVLIKGKRLDAIGVINMSMFLVDVSTVPDVEIGDEVTLIGGEDELAISVASFGDLSSQLNYELLTRLDKSIPRIIE